ncbi:hypothetical protein FRC12_019643 [Ceratobasidium sp. 428]|nr:hypothetical protein FRC12_019643 [Ceratobasidium sp. 428]
MEWANEEGNWWVRAETLNQWVKEAMTDWKKQVPTLYAGEIWQLGNEEVYDLVVKKKLCKKQFWDYLDQYTWDRAQFELDWNMTELVRSKEWQEMVEYQKAKEWGELMEEGEVLEEGGTRVRRGAHAYDGGIGPVGGDTGPYQ